jgi:site-specific recombinase
MARLILYCTEEDKKWLENLAIKEGSKLVEQIIDILNSEVVTMMWQSSEQALLTGVKNSRSLQIKRKQTLTGE